MYRQHVLVQPPGQSLLQAVIGGVPAGPLQVQAPDVGACLWGGAVLVHVHHLRREAVTTTPTPSQPTPGDMGCLVYSNITYIAL